MGNFDIDLDFGQVYEQKIKDLFEGDGSIEVKTERDIWADTGNMAIEIRSRGKPSGISITEAKWWVHVLADKEDDYCMLLFPTDKLKKIARKHFSKAINGGDNDTSKFVLLPLKEIFNGETI